MTEGEEIGFSPQRSSPVGSAIRPPPSFTLKMISVYYPRFVLKIIQIRDPPMKKSFLVILVLLATVANLGMSRRGQYDEEARAQEKVQKQMDQDAQTPEKSHPAQNFATGVKQMTVDNAKDALADTAEGTISKHPIAGTLEGARQGGDKVIDNTIKGVKKVVSLGYAKDDSYEVQEAEKGSGDAAKIKLFKF